MKDLLDREIEVGDVVIYTEPGAGRNLPPLCIGKVVNLTKAGVSVQQLDKDLTPVQVDDWYLAGTGIYYYAHNGERTERVTRVANGKKDISPVNVRGYEGRFFIMRKHDE